MAALPDPVVALAAALSRLPGIGPRSAERLALHLVQAEHGSVRTLADAILQARERVQSCGRCGALTESQPCPLCESADRANGMLCVVERPLDIISLEKSGTFRGRYHSLGGKISPLNGVGPEDLQIDSMLDRLGPEQIQEVILALGSDVEGEATAH